MCRVVSALHGVLALQGSIECNTPTMTTSALNQYADWLERYRRAWIERDADAASRLFTEDATYREQPFEAPFVGRAAIRDYWARVTASQTSVELRYGQPVVDGSRLAVEWWANLQTSDGPLTLAGEFLLLFAGNGECRELREYWVLTRERVEPPPGWGS
jgi:SnoaL-like protein